MTHVLVAEYESPEPIALTVGFFDGVHRGHRAVLDRLLLSAHDRGVASGVVTFDPHPRQILSDVRLPLLTSLDEKSELLVSAGIDHVIVVPFDRELSLKTPREFIKEILIEQLNMVHMVVGYNHALGHRGTGTADVIQSLLQDFGYSSDVVSPMTGGGSPVSSSLIRAALTGEGDVSRASKQLGRRYRLEAEVVPGDGRGRQLGFATANLRLFHPDKVVPLDGVYAVWAERRVDGKRYPAVMNIGVRPTVTQGDERVLEVHLIGFDGDLYGETISVQFVERIRPEHKFGGVQELVAQIEQDVADCRILLGTLS